MSIKSLLQFLSVFLKDKSRKNLFIITWELFLLTIKHRRIPFFYFSRHIYKKGVDNIFDYIPNEVFYKFSGKFNDSSFTDLLDNKLYFLLFYNRFNIPLPKLMMYNVGNKFIIDNESLELTKTSDFIDITRTLLNNSETKSIFIKKTYGSYGGSNTFKISEPDIKDEKTLDIIFKEVIKSGFLFQQTIDQHPDLNRLNSSCLNTIRMDTFVDRNGDVEIISAFLRLSIKNSHVDNLSSGGCLIGIDIHSGRLKKYAYTSVTKEQGKILTEHPVTNVKFEGYLLPEFDEVKALTLKIASVVPGLRLIGWDIAITKDGPVIIEGNDRYTIQANDLAYGGYRSNPVFRKVMDEFALSN